MTEIKSSVESEIKQSIISVRALCKSFAGTVVLDNLDLDLYRGENLVVLGRSGSGKSVLIKIIAGLLQADSGTVNVLGNSMENLSPKALQQLRLKIGFSFQKSALYDSMTVRENLEFALVRNRKNLSRTEIDKAVKKVLDDVQLFDSVNKLPSELSGGQTKRIGVARALILHPEIMFYDEPTAGLDPVTAVEINKMMIDVQQEYKTSSIIITHDLTCAKTTGNRIAVLNEGRIISQGSFDEVFDTDDQLVRSFYDYNFTS